MDPESMTVTKSLLETTLNTRDLGGYESLISKKRLKSWQILRSDVPNYPSENDFHLLKSHRISTIIDLRGKKDIQRKPNGFAGREDFLYVHIPIDEGSGVPENTDKVSESYLTIAESEKISKVFQTIAFAPEGVMFNCTAGKDRTGVVSAILLGLCGVSEVDIIKDYMRTKALNQERFALIRQNFPDIDMNIVLPHERYMTEFIARIKEKYGSFCGYLTAIGLTEAEIKAIRSKLLG